MAEGDTCEKCRRREAVVGWGEPAVWVCLDCFENALKKANDVLGGLLGGMLKDE